MSFIVNISYLDEEDDESEDDDDDLEVEDELVKLLKLTGAVLQISIKIMLWYVFTT